MGEWQPIETADRPTETVIVGKFVGERLVQRTSAYWHEGDTTAGWASALGMPKTKKERMCWQGSPLKFKPTHWRQVEQGGP